MTSAPAVYSGVYEWQSASLATEYADRMVTPLAPFSNPGTARYHVLEHLRRNDFLSDRRGQPKGSATGWWQLAEAPAPIGDLLPHSD